MRIFDAEVFASCQKELDRQQTFIELIASENIVSKAVLLAAGSVLTNKYAEGYPGKRYYGGCECVDIVENIAKERAVFMLIYKIQEEVHRFSVEYHRKKQKKTMTAMTLTEIEGVGNAKARNLLKHFKTISAIRNASVDELCNVEGISEKIALNIYNHYHREDKND